MDRIYMTCLNCCADSHQAKVAVFLKGEREHINELISFLGNQDIECDRFSDQEHLHMEEMTFFDDGFYVMTTGERWSFYELRNYIQTYANTWKNDYLLRHSLIHDLLTCDEDISFDDAFYVEMAKQIDSCEDRYYLAGKEISHFFDGIQKLLCNNLKLYWVATEFADHDTQNLSYLTHVPSTLPKQDVSSKISNGNDHKVIVKDITFNGELLARFHLCPGPFSPKQKIIHEFVDYIILHIDDFVFGIISHQREVQALREEIKSLTNTSVVRTKEDESRDKRSMKILLLGSLHMSANKAQSIFREHGFVDVTLVNDWEKIKGHDANNLLKVRGHYDRLLLGQVPHKMKNADNIISMIESEPDRYPPHVILRNKSENLKITSTSLKEGLEDLQPKLDSVCCALR